MSLKTVSFREHFVAVQCALGREYIPTMLEDADKVAKAMCKKWGHEEEIAVNADSLIAKTCARCGGPL
jgi:hypothetical protein